MKQARVTGVRQAAVVDVPAPKPKADWVLVKVHAAPMCTEFKGFVTGDGAHGYGHEAAGEVVEVAQPCGVKVGDRVVMQVIERSPVVSKMVTHVLPLSQIQKAWELQCSGQCGKIILKPWE